MIPYEVIRKGRSDVIKCGYCSQVFKTVELHEKHRCKAVAKFKSECLSCHKPYDDHLVLKKESEVRKADLTTGEEGEARSSQEDQEKPGTRGKPDSTTSELYACCICHKNHPNLAYLVRHIKYHAGKKRNVRQPGTCVACGKTFKTKQQLIKHEATHKDLRPYKCEHCEKPFKTADGVKRHLYIHSDARPFSCPTCHKTFKAKHLMKKHQETHSDVMNYECTRCGKKFKARNSLRDHLLVHDGIRPYKCDLCDQTFVRRSHVATHKIIHSEVKPFSCKVCQKCFGRREHLRVHERIHSGEKPFHCTKCERSFNQQAGLQAHLMSHSDERPHSCSTCGKSFKYPSQIKHHACKPDMISPCMVDLRGANTSITEKQTVTTIQESKDIEVNFSDVVETPNVESASSTEDTVILIQIDNSLHDVGNEENAISVDVVTATGNRTESQQANVTNAYQLQDSERVTIFRESMSQDAKTIATVAQIGSDKRYPNIVNLQTTRVTTPSDMSTAGSHDTFAAAGKETNCTMDTSVLNLKAADFSPKHPRELYVRDTNAVTKYGSPQEGGIASEHQHNTGSGRANTKAYSIVTAFAHRDSSVSQSKNIATSHEISQRQNTNFTQQHSNTVLPHEEVTPLVGNSMMAGQNTVQTLSNHSQQPVWSESRVPDNNQEMFSTPPAHF